MANRGGQRRVFPEIDTSYEGEWWTLLDDLEHRDSGWRLKDRVKAVQMFGRDADACSEWLRTHYRRLESIERRKHDWHERSAMKRRYIKLWLADRKSLSNDWAAREYWKHPTDEDRRRLRKGEF